MQTLRDFSDRLLHSIFENFNYWFYLWILRITDFIANLQVLPVRFNNSKSLNGSFFRHTVQKIRRKGTGDTPILPFCAFATASVFLWIVINHWFRHFIFHFKIQDIIRNTKHSSDQFILPKIGTFQLHIWLIFVMDNPCCYITKFLCICP